QVYSRVIRQGINVDGVVDDTSFDTARSASETFLQQWPVDKRHNVLMGAAAYLYAQGPQNGEPVRDALIWQLGAKRDEGGNGHFGKLNEVGQLSAGRLPGIAQQMLNALRQIGLLGEPMWTTSGAILYYNDEPCRKAAGVPVRLNGVWLNLLNATGGHQYAKMSDVPALKRDRAKARIDDFVQDKFRGMMLSTEVTDTARVVTRTPHGNLFGYVQRDHELAAIRH
ncbi:MAG: hypothetical protein GY952_15545, partial [Rhodobacteraceae bacterium]|nr:hypothetical protein [Paracoccaceae bacterium]